MAELSQKPQGPERHCKSTLLTSLNADRLRRHIKPDSSVRFVGNRFLQKGSTTVLARTSNEGLRLRSFGVRWTQRVPLTAFLSHSGPLNRGKKTEEKRRESGEGYPLGPPHSKMGFISDQKKLDSKVKFPNSKKSKTVAPDLQSERGDCPGHHSDARCDNPGRPGRLIFTHFCLTFPSVSELRHVKHRAGWH